MVWIDLLAGLVGGIGGGAAWRWIAPPRNKRLAPICSCEHGFGTHDIEGCQGETKTWHDVLTPSGDDSVRIYELRQCTCKHYDGPPAYLS